MGSRLDQIKEWANLAKAARYNAQNLAQLCEVSSRQLRRYFKVKMQETSHNWLRTLRMSHATELIRVSTPIKIVAVELGYKDAAHFTHDFTDFFGAPPSRFGRRDVCPNDTVGNRID
jgi:transcriptional regulator GlxA family with amidase domain